eukprot:PhF_6_TR11717/c0_g2_i6/m.19111
MDRTRRRFDTAERQTRRRQDEVAERRQGGRGGRASGGRGRGGRGQSSPPRRTVTGYQMRRVGREVNESRRAGRGRGGRGGQSGSGQRQIGRGRFEDFMPRRALQGFAAFGKRREAVLKTRFAERETTRRTRGGRGGRGGRAGGRGNTGGDRRRIGRGRGQQQAAPSGRFRAGLKPLDNRRGGRGGRGGAQGRGGRGPSLVDRDALDKQLDSYRK